MNSEFWNRNAGQTCKPGEEGIAGKQIFNMYFH